MTDDRTAWLAARREGITGTDVAAILGLSPFASAWDVYLEKVEGRPEREETPDLEWGRRLEDHIADWFRDHYGHKIGFNWLERPGLVRHPERPWMIGSPDRVCRQVHGERFGVLEIKTARSWKQDDWGADGDAAGAGTVPAHYRCQLQWYLTITSLPRGWFCVSVGDRTPRVFPYEHDPELERLLVTEAEKFWQLVQARTPPPVNWSDTCRRYLERTEPIDTFVELDSEAEIWARAERDAADREEVAKRERELARNHLRHLLGGATKGQAGRYRLSYTESHRTTFDDKRFKIEHPEMFDKYLKQSAPIRTLRITERKA